MAEPRELTRRLRAGDHLALAELCRYDTRLSRYFDRHDVWLSRALEDIKRPGRAVFGYFSPIPRRSAAAFSTRLDACLFLKHSEFDVSAELKNPVLRRTEGESYSRALDSRLLPLVEKAVRHCEVREIAKLEIELPQIEHEIVSLFLKLGFRVAAIRERYRPSLPVCVLEKTLGEVYHADPFAVDRMASWLIRTLLPARTIDKVAYQLDTASVPRIRFEGYPQHQAFSRHDSASYAKRLVGSLLILDEGDCDDHSVNWVCSDPVFRREQLRYVLAHKLSDTAKLSLENAGVNAFEFRDLEAIAGSDRSSLRVPFARSEVGGIVTVLEEERVKEYMNFQTPWVYYLLSGLGEALDVPAEGQGDLLAIFCPNWTGGVSGIIGVAEIQVIETRPVKDAADAFPTLPRALSSEDLSFYMSRRDKELVTILRCRPIVSFDTPIDVEDPIWNASKEDQDYIAGALEEMNSVYFSKDFGAGLKQQLDQSNNKRNAPLQQESQPNEKSMNIRKILFVASDPQNTAPLKIQEELRNIKDELRGAPQAAQVVFEYCLATRPADLSRAMLAPPRPAVLHFSGHGSKQGAICLQDEAGLVQAVPAGAIANLLEPIAKDLEVVVLNACYSAAQAKAMLNHVPFVVGMSDSISDLAAIAYAVGFYQGLFNAETVPTAHKLGCAQISMRYPSEKSIPSLLTKE